MPKIPKKPKRGKDQRPSRIDPNTLKDLSQYPEEAQGIAAQLIAKGDIKKLRQLNDKVTGHQISAYEREQQEARRQQRQRRDADSPPPGERK